MIAQQNCQHRLSSLLLHQACFVAKSIGIHQQNALSADGHLEDDSERNLVFWALFVVDKQVSITVGASCCLPSFDCDVSLPKSEPTNLLLRYWVARIKLAQVQEDIYQNLYSSQACRRRYSETRSQLARLERKLAWWTSNNKELCTNEAQTEGDTLGDSSARTALSYFYHSTRFLLHRLSKEKNDKQQCRDNARSCTQIFARLNPAPTSIESAIMIRQITRDQFFVPFFVLFAELIQDPSSDQSAKDLRLMLRASDILRQVQRSESRSYIPQLLTVASCCQAASAIAQKASLRRRPSSSTNSLTVHGAPSAANGSASHNGDPWAAVRSTWATDGAPRPPTILPSAPDTFGAGENWDFDFANLLDVAPSPNAPEPEIPTLSRTIAPAAAAADLTPDDMSVEAETMEVPGGYNTAPWPKERTRATGTNGGWGNRDFGSGAASCGPLKPLRWSETWLGSETRI